MMNFVRIIAALGLMIGGALAQSSSGLVPSGFILGNPTASRGLPVGTSVTAIFDRAFSCSQQGSILYRGPSTLSCLTPGVAGAALLSGGVGGNPTFGSAALGTLSQQNANSVAITGGSIAGITPLSLLYGGTGASTIATARTALGLGSMAVQDSSAVSITGGSIACAAPSSATDCANKAYVDSAAVGYRALAPSKYATTAVLPNTPTYSNGASGVGATLTAGSNAALVVDGVTPAVSDRVLVKDQATMFQNGIYTVTTVGSGAAAWALTRATDFDAPVEMIVGSVDLITAGTANTGSQYALTGTVTTVGTTAVIFNQTSLANSGVLSLGGNSGSISVDATTLQFNAGPTLAVKSGTSGATFGLLSANKTDSGNNLYSGSNAFNGGVTLNGLIVSAAATTAIGTSGATLGLLNASKTDSGNNVYSGSAAFNGGVTLGGLSVTAAATTPIGTSGATFGLLNASKTDSGNNVWTGSHIVGSGSGSALIDVNGGSSGVGAGPLVRFLNTGSGGGTGAIGAYSALTGGSYDQSMSLYSANTIRFVPGFSNLLTLYSPSNAIVAAANAYINFTYGTAGFSGYGFRDNSGTVQAKNSGGSWFDVGISECKPIEMFGGSGDGTTDNAAAYQAFWVSLGGTTNGCLQFKSGIYYFATPLSNTVSAGQSITIQGAGRGITQLKFASGGFGINVAACDLSTSINLKRMSFFAMTSNTQQGVTIVGNNFNGCVGKVSKFDELEFRGFTTSQYWSRGLYIQDLMNLVIDDIFWVGCAASCPSTKPGVGIYLYGSALAAIPTSMVISRVNATSAYRCIEAQGWIQGVLIANSTCVDAYQGYYMNFAVSGPTIAGDQCSVVNSETDTADLAIYIEGCNAGALTGNHLLMGRPGYPSSPTVIGLGANTSSMMVSLNTIRSAQPASNGIVVSGGSRQHAIFGNVLNGAYTPIWLQSGSYTVKVTYNINQSGGTTVLDNGSGNTVVGN